MILLSHFLAYTWRTLIQKDTCTSLLIPALLSIDKALKPKCLLADELIKKIWYILFSHKTEWNTAICSNMGRFRDYDIQWSQTEKDNYMILLIWGILFFKKIKCTYIQNRNRLIDIEHKLVLTEVTGRRREGEVKLGAWIKISMLYIK